MMPDLQLHYILHQLFLFFLRQYLSNGEVISFYKVIQFLHIAIKYIKI